MHYIKIALHDKKFMIIFSVMILFVLVTVFAGVFAPHDPIAQNYDAILQAPNKEYPFGTDQVGRCILSRILYGGKSSLLIAIIVIVMYPAMISL